MKTRYKIALGVLVLLVAVRLALPSIAKKYINKELDAIEGYHASIDRVGMQLYRGAFQINGLRIVEEASADTSIALVWLPTLDFSIDWRAILKGRIVAEVSLDSPEFNLTKPADDEEENISDYRIAFFEDIQELNPIEINNFTMINGSLAYRDPTSTPEVNVSINNLNIQATNLGNVESEDDPLPAWVEIDGTAMGTGSLYIDARLNLLKATPDFDVNMKFEEIEIAAFNDFTEARANLSIQSGLLYFYSEVVAAEGELTGYVKPIVEDLTVAKDSSDNFVQNVYNSVVQGVANVLENPKKDQIATRVNISGTLDTTETRPMQAFWNLLRNAFIEAYSREIDYVLDFGKSGNQR